MLSIPVAVQLFCLSVVSGEVLRIGGLIQDSGVGSYGKAAWEAWRDWVNENSATAGNFTVDLVWSNSSDTADVATEIPKMTSCDGDAATCVDVLILPYTSSASITGINSVHTNFSGPIMVWGAASDSIFSSTCVGHNCYGTFSVASEYLTSGLEAIDDAYDSVLQVALIQNSNSFSSTTCDGASTYIDGQAGLNVSIRVTTSAQSDLDSEADQDLIASVIAAEPDVVGICGHNGFVEPVIVMFGNATFRPKAIIATNSLTSSADEYFGDNVGYQNCVMMPSHWDDLAMTSADSITGMTNTEFDEMMGEMATYHAASAYAAGIVITHAMASSSESDRIAELPSLINALDSIDSFYGALAFDSTGAITKEMFTMQEQHDEDQIVAPSDVKTADVSSNLADCEHWAVSTTSDDTSDDTGDDTGDGNATDDGTTSTTDDASRVARTAWAGALAAMFLRLLV